MKNPKLIQLFQLNQVLKKNNLPVTKKLQHYAFFISATLEQAHSTNRLKVKYKRYLSALKYVYKIKRYLFTHLNKQFISPYYYLLIQQDLTSLADELENIVSFLNHHLKSVSP